MALADVLVRIGANIDNLKEKMADAERTLKRSGRKLSALGSNITASLSIPIVGVGVAAVKAAADFERMEQGLSKIMGSAEAAKAEMMLLRQEAEKPGLTLEQAIKGSVRLQAVGFSAEQSRESIAAFGNALSLVGGTSEQLDGVTLALSQIASKGKVFAEEINQINERVPQIRAAMQAAFGTSNTEALQKMGISAGEFVKKVTEELQKLPQATDTISNSFTNLFQEAKILGATIGKELNRAFNIQGNVKKLTEFIKGLSDRFSKLDDGTKKAIFTFGAFLASIGPLVKAIGLLKLAFATMLGPVGLIITAIGAVASALIFAYHKSKTFRSVVLGLKEIALEVFKVIQETVGRFIQAFKDLVAGDFKSAVKNFGDALIRTNPIGIALTEGKRLGKAFSRGFEEGQQDREKVPDFVAGAKGSQSGFGKVDLFAGGGTTGAKTSEESKPRKTFEALAALSTRAQGSVDLSESFPALDAFSEKMTLLINKNKVFGDSTTLLKDKIALYKETITSLLAEGLTPSNTQVQFLVEKMNMLNEALENMNKGSLNGFSTVLKSAAGSMVQLAASGEKSFKKLGKAALGAAAQVARANIIKAVTSFAADAFAKLGIFGAILAATAPAIVGGLFNKLISSVGIPALAAGGLAKAPTLAVVGDNPNARVDPEVIAPLSKLQGMMGGVHVTGTLVAHGTDLRATLEATDKEYNRLYGR